MSVGLGSFGDDVTCQLYSAATNVSASGNLCVSPISIVYATMLVYLGSKGATKSNFEQVYHLDPKKSQDQIIKPFADTLNALNPKFLEARTTTTTTTTTTPPSHDKNKVHTVQLQHALITETRFEVDPGQDLELNFANGVFLQTGMNVVPNYLTAVQQQLKAEVIQKDFAKNADAARVDINNWVEDKTNGKIKDLIPRGGVDSSSRAVLANALYFKASWLDKFDKSGTRKMDFTLLNGQKKPVDMMGMVKRWNYAEDADLNAQYLELPYRQNQASFLIILPKVANGLRAVEKKLTGEVWRRLASTASSRRVDLDLPKFKIETTLDATELLKSIGITTAFTDKADLTGISPDGGVRLSKAFHKTFIDVNEEGTEAAAATGIGLAGSSLMKPEEPVAFKVDHPFLFAIRHNPTKTILFVGRFEQP